MIRVGVLVFGGWLSSGCIWRQLWAYSLVRSLAGVLDANMAEQLITRAMQMAVDARGVVPSLIVHSERGSQHRSNCYIDFLERHNIIRSMSRKDSCWDNAVMESFCARLKV